MIEINKIINGDSLTELKKLPSESVDCVITSPPYWALRDYKTNPQIWDGKSDCEHDFSIVNHKPKGGGMPVESTSVGNNLNVLHFEYDSNFCSKCGAWRGELGLEPTFQLYIKHLCDIFDEVKRVLKKTGTCWINISDTYYTKSGSNFENDNLNPKSAKEVSETTGINKANQLRGKGLLPDKCLCQIPSRFALEMCNSNYVLKEDLTPEEKSFVIGELIKRGII